MIGNNLSVRARAYSSGMRAFRESESVHDNPYEDTRGFVRAGRFRPADVPMGNKLWQQHLCHKAWKRGWWAEFNGEPDRPDKTPPLWYLRELMAAGEQQMREAVRKELKQKSAEASK